MTRNALLFFGLFAVACGGSEPAKTTEPAKTEKKAEPAKAAAPAAATATAKPDGKALYTQYCVACHGADGKGNNGLGGDYSKVLPERTDDELIAAIKNGKTGDIGAMPPWGAVLNDEQIQAVLTYVKAEFGPKG